MRVRVFSRVTVSTRQGGMEGSEDESNAEGSKIQDPGFSCVDLRARPR